MARVALCCEREGTGGLVQGDRSGQAIGSPGLATMRVTLPGKPELARSRAAGVASAGDRRMGSFGSRRAPRGEFRERRRQGRGPSGAHYSCGPLRRCCSRLGRAGKRVRRQDCLPHFAPARSKLAQLFHDRCASCGLAEHCVRVFFAHVEARQPSNRSTRQMSGCL